MSTIDDTAARTRTKRAIVAAATRVLAASPAASLGDIADAAEVGRTTLHRYFAERSDLIAAVAADVRRQLADAEQRARLAEGSGRDALIRLAREYFDLGDALSLMFAGDIEVWSSSCSPDAGVGRPDTSAGDDIKKSAIARGHAEGSIDPALPAGWIESLMWCALYAGWSYTTETGCSRHDSLQLITRSLDGAIAPRPTR